MDIRNLQVQAVCWRTTSNNQKAMLAAQAALDSASGVRTRPMLNVKFLTNHPVATTKFGDLLDVMADCVKTAASKRCSVAVYPIEIASDGTMTMPPEETVVKAVNIRDLSNFGKDRLGISVSRKRLNPPGFLVAVGPFFELQGYAKNAVARR